MASRCITVPRGRCLSRDSPAPPGHLAGKCIGWRDIADAPVQANANTLARMLAWLAGRYALSGLPLARMRCQWCDAVLRLPPIQRQRGVARWLDAATAGGWGLGNAFMTIRRLRRFFESGPSCRNSVVPRLPDGQA